jgi:hypothetical protein
MSASGQNIVWISDAVERAVREMNWLQQRLREIGIEESNLIKSATDLNVQVVLLQEEALLIKARMFELSSRPLPAFPEAKQGLIAFPSEGAA